jgi:hypothetical protein
VKEWLFQMMRAGFTATMIKKKGKKLYLSEISSGGCPFARIVTMIKPSMKSTLILRKSQSRRKVNAMITHNSNSLKPAKQIEEMWDAYDSEKLSSEQNLAEQLRDEMLTIEDDKITDKEEEPLAVKGFDFSSSEDIRDIINEEIEQKLEWAQANACRAYIDSTF